VDEEKQPKTTKKKKKLIEVHKFKKQNKSKINMIDKCTRNKDNLN